MSCARFSLFLSISIYLMLGNSGCTLRRSALGPVRAESVEPALRLLSEQRPDSTVGLLLRLSRAVSSRDSADLSALGLALVSAQGTVVTGRARARSALQLTRLPAVQWIEVSMSIPPSRRPMRDLPIKAR